MIEKTNEPVTATGEQTKPPEGDLVQTARDAGAAAQERLGDLRDAALSSLDEAKSTATERLARSKLRRRTRLPGPPAVSKRRPRRWRARPCSRTCFAKPRTA